MADDISPPEGYDDEDIAAIAASPPDEDDPKDPDGKRPPTELDKRIGQCIRVYREAYKPKKLSLATLGQRINDRTGPDDKWYATRILRLETGERRATYDDVHAILGELGVNTTEFYVAAGLITLPATTVDMLAVDTRIAIEDRNLIARDYHRAIERANS